MFAYNYTLATDFVTIDCSILTGDQKVFKIIDCSGKIKITNLGASNAGINIYGFKGEIIIDSSCTAGTINIIGGSGKITDSSAGTTVNIDGFGICGGATQQQIRDSMKLSPTAGSPAAGSVDEHLDDNLTRDQWVNFQNKDVLSRDGSEPSQYKIGTGGNAKTIDVDHVVSGSEKKADQETVV